MKNKILLLTILALSGLSIQAQVSGYNPPDAWKNSNKHNRLSSYRSVNSILFRPGKEVDSNWDVNVWNFQDSIRNTYNSSGNILQKLIYNSSLPSQTIYVYNANEKLVSATSTEWSGSSWVNQTLSTYSYDANGNQTEDIQYNGWNGTGWQSGQKQSFTYDVNNSRTQNIYQNWDGATWINTYKDEFTWSNQHMVEQISYAWDVSAWGNSWKMNCTYVSGQLNSMVASTWTGTSWQNASKLINMTWFQWSGFFDINTKLTSYTEQVPNGILWKDTIKYSVMYDPFGNPTDFVMQAKPGTTYLTFYETKNLYQYDANNNITQNITQNWVDAATGLINTTKKDYSEYLSFTTVPCTPPQSGAISGNSTVTTATSETYSVMPVTGTTGYSWTLPSGWSGNSTSNSITVVVGTGNGAITVIAVNSCGASASSSLALTHGSSGSSIPQAIAAGYVHSLSICDDGTVRAWGRNIYGDFGNGTLNNSNTPTQVNTLTGVIDIAAGFHHSLALKSDGTVWAFGYNIYGALGNGTSINSNIPIQVMSLSGITAIAAGYQYSMALKNDGTVWAWGRNERGQLGNGSHTDMYIPVQAINLTGIIAISIGDYHSLALKNDGTVWAFGWNNFGQIGVPVATSYIPNHVSSLTGIIAISAGSDYSLALKSDGTIWSWGRNNAGQLGNGTYTTSNIPVPVSSLTNITAISAGTGYSLGLQNDGTVKAWGSNVYGTGNGTNTASNVPVAISSLTGVTALSAGSSFSLALKSDGTVKAWGRNMDGELGIGSFTNSNIPIQVINLCNVIGVDEMDFDNSAVSVFPNPTSGIFQIISNPLLKDAGIKIYNIQGQLVFESSKLVSEINLSSQPKGIYFIRITNEKNNNVINRKITIQ